MKKLLIYGAAGLGLLALLLAVAAVLVYPTLPDIDELKDYQPKQPLRVFTADGVQIAEFGAERRNFQTLDQIPEQMQQALLAVEDHKFYEHGGLYYTGIARALLANLLQPRSQGASTITQQLARTVYLSKKKIYSRKFVEILLALKMEAHLSKREILEIYMNQIYLGQRAYGFEAASAAYFGKPLEALSLAETAMLAGLPPNPAYANPVVNFERARKRQHVVLNRMHQLELISKEQAQAAKAEVLHIRSAQDPRLHAEYAAEMVRQAVHAQYGEATYTLGLKAYTTLISSEQAAAYRALRRSLMELERRKPYRGPEGFVNLGSDASKQDAAITQALAEHPDNDELRAAVVTELGPGRVVASLQSGEDVIIQGEGLRGVQAALSNKAKEDLKIRRGSIIRVLRGAPSKADPKGAWAIVQTPEAEGAFVALEPATGRVHALVGGFDFAKNKLNHVTQAWRQPGSSFKPFVYSAALEQGIMPSTLVNDAPLVFGDWAPKNYDGTFDGPMTVRQALARSKNMVTLRLMEAVGPAKARDWAARFGLEKDRQPEDLTLALGSGSVTPMQMASAYAVFANGGHKLTPILISKIIDNKGDVVFQAAEQAPTEENRVISERNAYLSSSLLQEVARSGTAARAQAQLRRPDLYGKTGTTNDAVDAWFAGFQPGLAAVVWIGYDQPRGLGDRETGGGLALPVWIDYMTVALKNQPVRELNAVDGLVQSHGDWSFEEYVGEAGIKTLGLDAAQAGASVAPAAATTGTAASIASAAAGSAASAPLSP